MLKYFGTVRKILTWSNFSLIFPREFKSNGFGFVTLFFYSNPTLEVHTLNVRCMYAAPGRGAGGGGGAEGEAHSAAPAFGAPHSAASLCPEGATCKSLSLYLK
jgi:hypothetical protein